MSYAILTKEYRGYVEKSYARFGSDWFEFDDVSDIIPKQSILLKMWHRGFVDKKFRDMHESRTKRVWKISDKILEKI